MTDSEKEKNQNRIHELDLLKVIACIMVVGIHTLPRGTMGNCLLVALRYAVPMFFAISGFFYAKMNDRKRLEYIEKIFWIFVVASLVCLAFTNKKLYSKMNVEKLFRILFITGVRRHLWYLVALIEALTAKAIMEKVIHRKNISRYVFFATSFVLMYAYYYKTIRYGFKDNNTLMLDNFLVAGAMIEAGGMIWEIDCEKVKAKRLAIISAIAYFLIDIGFFMYCGYEPQNASLLLYISTGCILLYFVKRNKLSANRGIKVLSDASLYVYVLHPLLPGRIAKLVGIESQGILSFFCTLIASFLIAIMCVYIKKVISARCVRNVDI